MGSSLLCFYPGFLPSAGLNPPKALSSDPSMGGLNVRAEAGLSGKDPGSVLVALQAVRSAAQEKGALNYLTLPSRGAATTRLARNRQRIPLPRLSSRTWVSLGGAWGLGVGMVVCLSCSSCEAICLPACPSLFCLTVHCQRSQLCEPWRGALGDRTLAGALPVGCQL